MIARHDVSVRDYERTIALSIENSKFDEAKNERYDEHIMLRHANGLIDLLLFFSFFLLSL